MEETRCKASLEVVARVQGHYTSKDLTFVQTGSECRRKTSGKNLPFAGKLEGNNGIFFAKNGIPMVSYGTRRADTHYHGVDEFVYLEDMRKARDLIVNLGIVAKEKIA